MQDANRSIFDFSLDDDTRNTFKVIAVWAAICGVAGFITLAFAIFSTAKTVNELNRVRSASNYVTGYVLGIAIYAVVVFMLNYFLFQFGSKTKSALVAEDQAQFNNGLRNLKMYIRFWGIILIIIIILFLLLFIIGILSS